MGYGMRTTIYVMPFRNIPRYFIAVTAVLLAVAAPVIASPVGTVLKSTGRCEYRPKAGKGWAGACMGRELMEGDRLRTGKDGRAEIRLKDGTTLSLGDGTELEITVFLLTAGRRNATISLVTGKLRASVAGFSGRSRVKVRTPTGVAGVKGTDFMVMNRGKANIFFGNTGEVNVSGGDGDGVLLTPGRMTENTRGHVPIEPVTVEPDSPLADAREQLLVLTDMDRHVEWRDAGRLPVILARWNINYGHYLADSGRYMDALEVFQIAVDLSEIAAIRAEAHLERGTVYARNLGEADRALEEYIAVVERYPELPHVENALYSIGMIYMEKDDMDKARDAFLRYLRNYPDGKHSSSIELLLEGLKKD